MFKNDWKKTDNTVFLSARELATPLIQPPKGDFLKSCIKELVM